MLNTHRNNSMHTTLAALLGMLLLGALQLTPHAPDVLKFDRSAFDRGVLWPLLTSQLVHLSVAHAALNALSFMGSLLVWGRWVSLRHQLIGLAGGALGVAMVLVLDTDASYYAGLSGALYGLWAGNAIALLTPLSTVVEKKPSLQAGNRQCATVLILAGLLIKLWLQGGNSPEPSLGWLQVPVYHPAHWAGLIGGWLLTSMMLMFRYLTLPRH